MDKFLYIARMNNMLKGMLARFKIIKPVISRCCDLNLSLLATDFELKYDVLLKNIIVFEGCIA